MSPRPTPPCVDCARPAAILAVDDRQPRCVNCNCKHGCKVAHCPSGAHEQLKLDEERLASECVFGGAMEGLLYFNHWCEGTLCIVQAA